MHLIPLQCPFWLFLTPQVRPAESTGDLKDAKAVDGVLKITVRFQYTPTADVTVVVKSSNAVAVNIGNADHPNSIHTFTAKTHNDKATFAIVSTGAASTGTTATVNFITVSDDPVFHGLTDSWTYTAGTKAGTQTSCASGDVAGSVKTGTKPGSVASYATTDLAIHTTRCQGSPSRTCTAAGIWTGAPLVCTPGDTFDHSIPWTAGFGDPAARTLGVKDGDVLKFVWTGGHNVYLMKDKAAFDSCDFSGGTNLGGASPVYHTMGAATTYFACKVGSHCANGQKLSAVIPAAGCDGVVNSGKVLDCAGACGGAAVLSGCDNKCGSTKAEDVCKVCAGNGKSCLGCDGVANSGKANDACGVCAGDGKGCKGCDGVENSGKVNDCLGACGGTAVLSGCDDTCNSTMVKDACSVCGGDGFSCSGGVDNNNNGGNNNNNNGGNNNNQGNGGTESGAGAAPAAPFPLSAVLVPLFLILGLAIGLAVGYWYGRTSERKALMRKRSSGGGRRGDTTPLAGSSQSDKGRMWTAGSSRAFTQIVDGASNGDRSVQMSKVKPSLGQAPPPPVSTVNPSLGMAPPPPVSAAIPSLGMAPPPPMPPPPMPEPQRAKKRPSQFVGVNPLSEVPVSSKGPVQPAKKMDRIARMKALTRQKQSGASGV